MIWVITSTPQPLSAIKLLWNLSPSCKHEESVQSGVIVVDVGSGLTSHPVKPHSSCPTLEQWLNLSESQFPPLKTGNNYYIYFILYILHNY